MLKRKISQVEFVISYFLQRPMLIISHVEAAYPRANEEGFENSNRPLHKLQKNRFMEKVAKGQSMFDLKLQVRKSLMSLRKQERIRFQSEIA